MEGPSSICRHSLLVFTDVGEEIDDELMIYYLMVQDRIHLDITMVFIDSQSLQHWICYFQTIAEAHRHENNTIEYITLADFKSRGGKTSTCCYDYILQAAPLRGYTGEKLSVNYAYVIQGNISPEQKSFNMGWSKTDDGNTLSDMLPTLAKWQTHSKLLEVSSNHCAHMRPSLNLINHFPIVFQSAIWFVAFKLCVGRVDPGRPGADLFAEGLLNSAVGRAANYTAVKNLYEHITERSFDDLQEFVGDATSSSCQGNGVCDVPSRLAAAYFQALYSNKTKNELTEEHGVTVLHKDSLHCLTRMNRALEIIFPGIWEGRDHVVYSDFSLGQMEGDIQATFERFLSYPKDKIILSCNPVYDLFAAHVLLKTILLKSFVSVSGNEYEKEVISPEAISRDTFLCEVCDILEHRSSDVCTDDSADLLPTAKRNRVS